MAGEAELSYVDVNGITAANRFVVDDEAAAAAALALFKKLTNARITRARFSTPVDVSGVPANAAAAANVETARAKMIITLSAPPADAGLPRQTVTLQIPAPVGTYINGLTGDPTNADIVALLGVVRTSTGAVCDKVEKVAYGK
jgi:hypothetical protein